METNQIRFNDGEAYELFMGLWSQLVGESFLDWVAPKTGLTWLDVGCGNGAFTETLLKKCSPASIEGIDPSKEQIDYASTRFAPSQAKFRQGDAMMLPYPNNSFDAAVMPLVIFFVPEPSVGVAEMVRVVQPGGIVTAYGWDLKNGGSPYEPVKIELQRLGIEVPMPPNPDAASKASLLELWKNAGLLEIEVCEISVERTYTNFDEYWSIIQKGASVGSKLTALSENDSKQLQERLTEQFRKNQAIDSQGQITCKAWANAVKGKVAG